MFRDYNTIYVLRGNTDEKSVVWTDLYQYGLIVKKTYNTEISSINREILRINSYLNLKKALIGLFTELDLNTLKRLQNKKCLYHDQLWN